jgi:hypothetical protein
MKLLSSEQAIDEKTSSNHNIDMWLVKIMLIHLYTFHSRNNLKNPLKLKEFLRLKDSIVLKQAKKD